MKTYIIPATTVVALQSNQMLASSVGVKGGEKVGNGYSSTDVSYNRQHQGVGSGLWSDMK